PRDPEASRGEGAGNLIPSPLRRTAAALPSKLLSKALGSSFGRHGERHRGESSDLATEEPFGPGAVLLPAFPYPCADRPLDPPFRVVREAFEQTERPVELAGSHPRSKRIRRGPPAPEVRGFGPREELGEPLGVLGRSGGDRARSESVRERPAGGVVHPTGGEVPGGTIVRERPEPEQFESDRLLLEELPFPERFHERSCLRKGPRPDPAGARLGERPQVGDPDAQDGHGRARNSPTVRLRSAVAQGRRRRGCGTNRWGSSGSVRRAIAGGVRSIRVDPTRPCVALPLGPRGHRATPGSFPSREPRRAGDRRLSIRRSRHDGAVPRRRPLGRARGGIGTGGCGRGSSACTARSPERGTWHRGRTPHRSARSAGRSPGSGVASPTTSSCTPTGRSLPKRRPSATCRRPGRTAGTPLSRAPFARARRCRLSGRWLFRAAQSAPDTRA